jgi:hypothetical protein
MELGKWRRSGSKEPSSTQCHSSLSMDISSKNPEREDSCHFARTQPMAPSMKLTSNCGVHRPAHWAPSPGGLTLIRLAGSVPKLNTPGCPTLADTEQHRPQPRSIATTQAMACKTRAAACRLGRAIRNSQVSKYWAAARQSAQNAGRRAATPGPGHARPALDQSRPVRSPGAAGRKRRPGCR